MGYVQGKNENQMEMLTFLNFNGGYVREYAREFPGFQETHTVTLTNKGA